MAAKQLDHRLAVIGLHRCEGPSKSIQRPHVLPRLKSNLSIAVREIFHVITTQRRNYRRTVLWRAVSDLGHEDTPVSYHPFEVGCIRLAEVPLLPVQELCRTHLAR